MSTNYLIDGMLSGTGMRDATNGGYVEPAEVGLSTSLARDIEAWQRTYEQAHFADFPKDAVANLDREGLVLASRAERELGGKSVRYFSNGLMKPLT